MHSSDGGQSRSYGDFIDLTIILQFTRLYTYQFRQQNRDRHYTVIKTDYDYIILIANVFVNENLPFSVHRMFI